MKSGNIKYLLICNTSDGLIAQLNGIVVQLQFAQRMGLVPIIYLHQRSYMFGGPNPYFDSDHGPNVWDYYYEPVGVSLDELQILIKEGKVYTLSTASELMRLYRWEPRSWFMNPYGYYRSVENRADGEYPAVWWNDEREKARAFLNDGTVRFRPSLLRLVDRFQEVKFPKHTLGLQLRGSDKFDFGVGPNLSRKVLPEEYFPHINRYLSENPDCDGIFVATDQRQWLKVLEKAYPGKIISYSEKSLSDSDDNRFHDADEKAARGIEVLVDLLLLSRCNYVIKCHAAVGEMALTLNPDVNFIDLNYDQQPVRVKRKVMYSVAVPCIRLVGAVWRKLSESGLALEKVVSVQDDAVLVGSRHRPLNTKVEEGERAPRPPLMSRRFVSSGFDWVLRSLADACFDDESTTTQNGCPGE